MKRWLVLASSLVITGAMLVGCENKPQTQNMEEQVVVEANNQVQDTNTEITPAEYEGQGEEMIHINQIGYRPQDLKVAVINSQKFLLSSFEVINADTQEVVFSGELTGKAATDSLPVEPKLDFSSGDLVYWADFSAVNTPGHYVVSVPEYGQSYPFVIQDRPYMEVKNALLKSLYYQRCGTALDEEHAGEYTHAVCHAELAKLYDNHDKLIDVSGGWHDAGDYGRYVSPGVNTVAFLLLSHELFTDRFQESINLPESGNGIPDILNEARYELNWLLKMQNQQTGGVYHKVTAMNFEGFIMPEKDTSSLYVLPISPTATGDFAAIMAMAARVYEPFDAKFAKIALAAATKAWAWLEANPDAPGYHNPSDVVTGEYGDNSARDETYWAAVELYKTTGNERYHDAVKSLFRSVNKTGLGWAEMSGFGTISYLTMDSSQADADVREELTKAWLKEADKLVARAKDDGYGISLAGGDYNWGSNMGVMTQATIFIFADMLKEDEAYIRTVHNLFHYLLGRNALDQSYVTGFGSKQVMHPHHRPSGSDGIAAPIPGLVAGGPNKNRQDPTAEKILPAKVFPARAFIDNQGSWSTNEITIYWNAPAIFVAAYLDR